MGEIFRVNYIVLVHDCPDNAERLIERIDADWARFYVHVDARCDIEAFRCLTKNNRVRFVANRVACRWGDLSLVDAVLSCYREILSDGEKGFIVLLSGHDYPLRRTEFIRNFFESHPFNNFVNIYSIPDPKKKSEGGGLERLVSYTFDCRNPRDGRMKAKIQPLSLRPKTILGFFRLLKYRRDVLPFACRAWLKKRKYPEGLAKCFNEMWMTLNYETVKYLVETIDSHPEYREYYKYTHIPDETMIGSILCANSKIKQTILPMCHYICWDKGTHGSPKTISLEDVDAIHHAIEKHDNILFARKFASNDSVLDYIDHHFLGL